MFEKTKTKEINLSELSYLRYSSTPDTWDTTKRVKTANSSSILNDTSSMPAGSIEQASQEDIISITAEYQRVKDLTESDISFDFWMEVEVDED
jgi:hypothetical protein